MTADFGKGFTVTNLQNIRLFYLTFPNSYTLRSELNWSHYCLLMWAENEKALSAENVFSSLDLRPDLTILYSLQVVAGIICIAPLESCYPSRFNNFEAVLLGSGLAALVKKYAVLSAGLMPFVLSSILLRIA